jgi:dienelactone hydrolase
MKTFLICFLLLMGMTASASARLQTKTIEYQDGNTTLEGYLAYDDQFPGKRPGILCGHEWLGINDYIQKRADMLAELGYVAFAADIYGKGVRPQSPQDANAESSKYKNDRGLLRRRVLTGFDVLKSQPNVDPARLGAVGYCFGGTTVLELARSGADVKGVVTFHGGLSSPSPNDAKNIKGEILVLHGADDPFVPPGEVAVFEKEMKKAKVKYHIIKYPGAVHGFTNPGNQGEMNGLMYNADADRKSWEEMKIFFARVFNESKGFR